jgi:hypothetical protein
MYLDEVKKVIMNNNCKFKSPAQMISAWSEFVEDCEEIYNWGLFEFDNDIAVRDAIDLLLQAETLKGFQEYIIFKEQVEKIDLKYKDLLLSTFFRDEQKKWWKKGILQYAGEEYSEDILKRYNVSVRID